jgi:uncharacterized protein (TIGR03437 family)
MSMLPNVHDDLFQALRAQNERSGAVSPLAATPAPRSLISAPQDGATVAAGSALSVYVHASASGAIASVELLVDGISAGSVAAYPYQLSWTPSAPGPHALVARVHDAAGRMTDSTPVVVTVPGAAKQPPSLLTVDGSGHGTPVGWFQRLHADGTMSYESLFTYNFATGTFDAVAVDLNAAAGDRVWVCLYAQNAQGSQVTATIGGTTTSALSAASSYAGFDQVNVEIPTTLAGRGSVDLVVTVDGAASNSVTISIK